MSFMTPDSETRGMAAGSLLRHSAAAIEARRLEWSTAGFEIGALTWRDVGSGWPYTLIGIPDGKQVDSVGVRCTRGATEMRVVVFDGGWADVEIANLESEQIETSAPLASHAAAVGLILDRAFQRANEIGRPGDINER